MKNLSVIFTPALFHDHNQAENAGEWYADKVLEDLILHHDTLFTNAETQSNMVEPKKAGDSPSSASVISLPFSAGGIAAGGISMGGIARKLSLSRQQKKPSDTTTSTAATTPIPTKNISTPPSNISTNIPPTRNDNNDNITKS